MSLIALKVDVDTWRGTREGAPALARLFERLGLAATFLFSLGPDHTGRALRRVFRPGFLDKVGRTSVLEHYGLRTLLYGTLLPGPDIGRREAATLRSIEASGFEAGVHTWDHVLWQDRVAAATDGWTLDQMRRATDRYAQIFGHAPTIHGAAGWQMNDAAFRAESALGYTVSSDTRGTCPFDPVDEHGAGLGPSHFPTTLPTLDELLGTAGCDASNVHLRLLALTEREQAIHVYTLHAELEGLKLMPAFERTLDGWRTQGHGFTSLGRLPAALDGATLPRCLIATGRVPGRSGTLAVQGRDYSSAPAGS